MIIAETKILIFGIIIAATVVAGVQAFQTLRQLAATFPKRAPLIWGIAIVTIATAVVFAITELAKIKA